ncbi:O-antigen polymerase [Bacteroides fluxus]|uniref:O-antigen polymerase n=1 Tax=Bacteroides fluxus TaxID=626930 RepID=UPI002353A427|nr:O-antigen polymerase [Bacteroides fluxus]
MALGLILNFLIAYWAFRCWQKGDKTTYLVILQFMILQSYRLTLLFDSPLRSDDIALLLVLITFFLNMQKGRNRENIISKIVIIFVCFIVISIGVSYVLKGIPLLQAIKAARSYLFILACYDIWLMKRKSIAKSLYLIFILNMVVAIIFIIQTFIPNIALLTDILDESGTGMTGFLGLRRFYSFPPLLPFCCLYSIFLFPQNKKNKIFFIILCFITLLFVQSRGMLIYTVFLIVLASLIFKASTGKKILYGILSLFLVILVNATVLSGDTGKKTSKDFHQILSGQITTMERPDGDATFAFRLWLIKNRNEEILSSDILNKIFGLGLFVQLPPFDAQRLGITKLLTSDGEGTLSIFTPDISYANHLSYLGYVGTFLFLLIFFQMIRIFKRWSPNNKYAQMGMLYMLYLLATGLNGSNITYSSCLIIPLLFLRISEIEHRFQKKYKNNEQYRLQSSFHYHKISK